MNYSSVIPHILVGTMILSSPLWAQEASLDVHFVENCGQWPEDERFVQLGLGPSVAVEPGALTWRWERKLSESVVEGVCLRFEVEDFSPSTRVLGEEASEARFHFLLGDDPASWWTDLPGHRRVRMSDVRRDMDLVVLGRNGRLAYDIELGPDSDLSDLVIHCRGAESLRIDTDGSLLVDTALGTMRQTPPLSWLAFEDGTKIPVTCRFRLLDQCRYGFVAELDSIPTGARLVVDPGLEWSTLLGTRGFDRVRAITQDSAGRPIVTGPAVDRNFPTTPGAYSRTFFGGDVFVTKFSDDGSSLGFSTFLGGMSGELGVALEVNHDDSILVGGLTSSADFPVTSNAAQPTYAGRGDGFVASLSSDGSSLAYGSFLGGTMNDDAVEYLKPTGGLLIAAGSTASPDFPTTPNSFDTTYNDAGPFYIRDCFLAVIDLSTGSLHYSTFMGGNQGDYVEGLEVIDSQNVVLCGFTESTDFPTTPGALDRTLDSRFDGFLLRLDLGSNRLAYSTFLGGTGEDYAQAMALTATGDAIVAGKTSSTDFPVTPGAFSTQHSGGWTFQEDAFIVQLSSDGSQVVWGTFLGGSRDEEIRDLAIGPWRDIFVVGESDSSDFPQRGRVVPANAGYDAFTSRLNSTGDRLLFSTLLGSSGDDEGWGITVDDRAAVTATGTAQFRDFPTTQGAYDTRWDLNTDIFVTRLPTGPVLSLQGTPTRGSSVAFEIDAASPLEVGHSVLVALSGTGDSGLLLPGGQSLPLTFDAMTAWSLALPWQFRGTIALNGRALLPTWTVPSSLPGTFIWSAAFTWDSASGVVSSVTCPLEIVIQ